MATKLLKTITGKCFRVLRIASAMRYTYERNKVFTPYGELRECGSTTRSSNPSLVSAVEG